MTSAAPLVTGRTRIGGGAIEAQHGSHNLDPEGFAWIFRASRFGNRRAACAMDRMGAGRAAGFTADPYQPAPAAAGTFDTARFAADIARAPSAGVAIIGYRYQGEFCFTARLTQPVDVIGQADLAAFADAHPGGLVISGVEVQNQPEGWLSGKKLRYLRRPSIGLRM